jgi:predicted DNA binding CopG/RHH family protein
MAKKIPHFKTDEEAEDFLEQDLSEYLSKENFKPTKFEFLPKDKKISLRFAEGFLLAVKNIAEEKGMSYQKYIRMAVEQSLQRDTILK